MKIVWSALVVALFLLGGCGGSGSSSSGNSNSSGENTSAIAGTYSGNAAIVARLVGESLSDTVTVVLTVTANGQIRISFENRVEFIGPVTAAGSFSASGSIKRLGLSDCRGILTVRGTISGNQVAANITSRNVACNLLSGSLRGTITASKI